MEVPVAAGDREIQQVVLVVQAIRLLHRLALLAHITPIKVAMAEPVKAEEARGWVAAAVVLIQQA
jgi:hypothetical protein